MNANCEVKYEDHFLNNRKLLMLHEFALLLNSSYNIEQVVTECSKKIKEVTESLGCHIMFSQFLLDKLELQTVVLDSNQELPSSIDLTKGGVAQETFHTGKIIIIKDTSLDPRIIPAAREHLGHRSMAAVPVVVKGETIGVVVVYSEYPDHYTQSDGQFLMMLGNHLGLAVENCRLMHDLNQAATVDSLTGAYNHRFLRSYLLDLIEQNSGQPVSLIMIDVDEFKSINDYYGHVTGDYVLQEVTKVLKRAVRNGDIVTRYGGDEFTVVLPGADIEETVAIGSRMEQFVARQNFSHGGVFFKVGITWGDFTLTSKDIMSINDIIKRADQKLYEMKNKKKTLQKS